MTPTSSVDAVQDRVILRLAGDAVRLAGTLGAVVSPMLFTVTSTMADEPALPAASNALVISVCEPFAAVVVFHAHEYGAVVSVSCRTLSR